MALSDNELPLETHSTLSKAEWRARLLAERADAPVGVHVSEARAIAATVRELPGIGTGTTACCYVPFGSEPGSLALVDALAATGARVLLPVVPDVPGPLRWAGYAGRTSLVPGRWRGLREPSGPRLPAAVIAEAAVVLVPALAVDRSGVRLGRGAGFYDRSLPLAAADARLIAVVRDSELVPRLPAEEHDVRMSAALTPGRGLIVLAED